MSKQTSRRRRRAFVKKLRARVDPRTLYRSASRVIVGSIPTPRPFDSKKGARGYNRRRDKKVSSE